MYLLDFNFFICDHISFLRIMNFLIIALNIIRYVVPIIVVIATIIDLFKHVINPKEKDGMNVIIKRLGAAIIVFLVPTLVQVFMSFLDIIFTDSVEVDYTSCYQNANSDCILNINNYLNCQEYEGTAEEDKCKTYRACNSYSLSSGCSLKTELDDVSCQGLNEDASNLKYHVFNYKNLSE